MTDTKELPAPDLVWGCDEIARIVNRTGRQTYHLIASGHLPAKKVGNHWVASRKKLLDAMTGETAA
jgi:hypothetical protein